MDKDLLHKIEKLKQKYKPDGFVILGIFGSYARGEETPESDIDILYEITDAFCEKYPGWKALTAIEDIRKDIESVLEKQIDFADKNALKRVGQKYILPEVMNV